MNVATPAGSTGDASARPAEVFLNHIGGAWRPAATGRMFGSRDPADAREIVGFFQASGPADVEAALQAASTAFPPWRRLSVTARAAVLERAARWIEERAAAFAIEMTREQGKPVALARDEFLRTAQTLRFYAAEAQSFGGETLPSEDPAMAVSTLREPLGVVAVITPWNFPVSIAARKIAPALVTGNTVIFKPSSDAPLSGYRLAEALIEAGLPPGVLNFVTGEASEIGAAITGAPVVRAISFTGSTAAGERIHRTAALTTRLQMELGGKNPLIVMDDADLDRAVDLTVKGGLSLSGQACTGTSRVIVVGGIKAAFEDKLCARVRAMRIGSGLEPGTEIGPIATKRQLRTVLDYIEVGKGEARLLCGGERLTSPGFEHGFYVSPAIFTDVSPDMRIAREEIFGPVIAIIAASDYDDAIAIANDSPYGLSAAIVTNDMRRAHAFVHDIESGTVKINRPTTGNVINAPFGGLKQSSTSTFRESGRAGLEFYTQIKTVYRGC